MRVAGLVLIAVPFLFGGVRLATTGTDVRYLLVAMASTVGAFLPGLFRRGARSGSAASLVPSLGLAVLLAAACAMVTGAQSVPAIAAVAVAFGLCSAGGALLLERAIAAR